MICVYPKKKLVKKYGDSIESKKDCILNISAARRYYYSLLISSLVMFR